MSHPLLRSRSNGVRLHNNAGISPKAAALLQPQHNTGLSRTEQQLRSPSFASAADRPPERPVASERLNAEREGVGVLAPSRAMGLIEGQMEGLDGVIGAATGEL